MFNSGLRRFGDADAAWKPDWSATTSSTIRDPPSFVVDVSEHYDTKRAGARLPRSQFTPPAPGSVATRLTTPPFRQLIESRDAQFGALAGVRWAEGCRARAAPAPHLFKDWTASRSHEAIE